MSVKWKLSPSQKVNVRRLPDAAFCIVMNLSMSWKAWTWGAKWPGTNVYDLRNDSYTASCSCEGAAVTELRGLLHNSSLTWCDILTDIMVTSSQAQANTGSQGLPPILGSRTYFLSRTWRMKITTGQVWSLLLCPVQGKLQAWYAKFSYEISHSSST